MKNKEGGRLEAEDIIENIRKEAKDREWAGKKADPSQLIDQGHPNKNMTTYKVAELFNTSRIKGRRQAGSVNVF